MADADLLQFISDLIVQGFNPYLRAWPSCDKYLSQLIKYFGVDTPSYCAPGKIPVASSLS